MLTNMADTLTIPLTPEAAARLRQLAETAGESLEELAQGLLEDTAAEFGDVSGNDAELARRVELWREHRSGASAEDVFRRLEARLAAVKPAGV